MGNDNVGSVLAKALAEMSIAQPTDGVDYLSRWLATYAEQEEAKAWRGKEEKTLAEERARTKQQMEEQKMRQMEQVAVVQAKNAKYDGFITKMNDPTTNFDDSCWSELLEVAQSVTNAQSVYLGFCDEEGIEGVEGKCIYYT